MPTGHEHLSEEELFEPACAPRGPGGRPQVEFLGAFSIEEALEMGAWFDDLDEQAAFERAVEARGLRLPCSHRGRHPRQLATSRVLLECVAIRSRRRWRVKAGTPHLGSVLTYSGSSPCRILEVGSPSTPPQRRGLPLRDIRASIGPDDRDRFASALVAHPSQLRRRRRSWQGLWQRTSVEFDGDV